MPSRYHDCVRYVNTNVFARPCVMDEMDSLSSRLKHARRERKLSQSALAGLSGVSQAAIGNIEAGIRGGGPSLASIANALAVRYFWLRDGEGDMEARAFSPDAQAIAEAFDALPTDTQASIDRRAWLYASIIGSIANQAATAANTPVLPPVAPPSAARRPRSKT